MVANGIKAAGSSRGRDGRLAKANRRRQTQVIEAGAGFLAFLN